MKITFITGNESKARHLANHLGISLAHKKLDLHEIQSLDLEEVVIDKVKRAYEIMKSPVLVEDVSLVFHEMGNLPGPLIKWFVTELKPLGLCNLLKKDRSATAKVIFALYDGVEMKLFAGSRKGTITKEPIGNPRFAWDNIFIPEGQTTVWGQLEEGTFASSSMRAPALAELNKYLIENAKRFE